MSTFDAILTSVLTIIYAVFKTLNTEKQLRHAMNDLKKIMNVKNPIKEDNYVDV